MGTYAADRQRKLEELFLEPAQRMKEARLILAGPQYPKALRWPKNVKRIVHLSPKYHPQFYSSSRFTLNLTRGEMVRWGYSPSVRLFEAAACGCTILSDFWPGIGSILKVGEEVLLSESRDEVIHFLRGTDDAEVQRIGRRARERVLSEHTSDRRAQEFENYVAFVSGDAFRSPGHLLTANGLAAGEQPLRSPSANLVTQ